MKTLSSLVLVALILPGLAPAAAQSLPDWTCDNSVGEGPEDIPHVYYLSDVGFNVEGTAYTFYTPNGSAVVGGDACPGHFSGELGFGLGGVWLFSREGPGANGGDGVVACYGSTDPAAGPPSGHHGPHSTIKVRDDTFGGAVALEMFSDWNRTTDNPSGNDNGDHDCGDGVIEPCDPDEDVYDQFLGCNPLDRWIYTYPQYGFCSGFSSLGFIDPLAPAFPGRVIAFAVSILAPHSCTVPGENSWTVPDLDGNSATTETLADFAGADGAVVVKIARNYRLDADHFGTGVSGAVWTDW